MIRSDEHCRLRPSAWLKCVSWLVLASAASASPQAEGKKVAVIIGNDSYTMSPLRNAVNDARRIDKALRAAGFRTILRENAKRDDFDDAISKLADQIGPDDTALFFYAGHGVQIGGENYLVPVDFELTDSIAKAKVRCYSVNQILSLIKDSRPKKTVMILDACRRNPLTPGQSAGLANPTIDLVEAFLGYSTQPNQVAADNPEGRNSPFTEALAEAIEQPGLTLQEVFQKVTRRVRDATGGQQTPYLGGSSTSPFYFSGASGRDTENDPTLVEKWITESKVREQREDWASSLDLLDRALAKKPGGAVELAARDRRPYLVTRRDAQARFDAGDFAASAKLYDDALAKDPFAENAAFEGVNSYLLNDHLDEAVALLKAVRMRGSGAAIEKANKELKELAGVNAAAAQELQSSIPPPPPIAELFRGVAFGTPDLEGGQRLQVSSTVDLGRWVKQLTPERPAVVIVPITDTQSPPPQPSNTPDAAAPKLDVLHVEIVTSSGTRDLVARRITPAGQESGFVQIDGALEGTPVLVDGKQAAASLPAKLQLPAGKYQVRLVQGGNAVRTFDLEVKPASISKFTVERP